MTKRRTHQDETENPIDLYDTVTRTLADSGSIPVISLGVWQVSDGRDSEAAVAAALEAG